jgi:predicted nucleic acid-binding protein
MIVLDTNVLISALIRDSITRKIIIESSFDFYFPEISFFEILKHKHYILKKSGYDDKMFDTILGTLFEYIKLVPLGIFESELSKAYEVMKDIDIDDSVFLATAVVLNASIWSDDLDFAKQKLVKIVKTKELIGLFEK